MIQWSKYPFIRLLIPLVTGIILCYYTNNYIPFNLSILAGVSLLLLFTLLYFINKSGYKQRWFTGMMINLVIIALGYSLTSQTFLSNQRQHFANAPFKPSAYVARVKGMPELKKNSWKILLEIEKIKANGGLQPATGNIVCYISDNVPGNPGIMPKIGDLIVFSKNPQVIKPPENPWDFNYKEYLHHMGIFHSIQLKQDNFKIIGENNSNIIGSFALLARNKLLHTITSSGLKGDEFSIAAALLTGYEERLDQGLIDSYAAAGVIHLLSVSGLHVGVIFLLAQFIFSFSRRIDRLKFLRPAIIIMVVWLYALVTGMAPPVIRASIMFTFIIFGTTAHRQSSSLNLLAAAAFLILIFNPHTLFNVGFQLSFSAVAGIILFNPVLRNFWDPVNPILKYLRDLLSISIAAQVFTTPFVLYYFHRFPTYFLLSNIFAIPLSGIIMYSGVFLLLTSWIPYFGTYAGSLMSAEIRLLNWLVRYIEKIPGAVVDNIHVSFFSALVLMSFFLILLLFLKYKRKVYAYFATGCIGVLIIGASVRQYHISTQHKIIFHRSAYGSLISLIDGRKHVVLSDSSLLMNQPKLDFQLKGLKIEAGLYDPLIKLLSTTTRVKIRNKKQFPEFYTFHGKRIVIINSDSYLPGSEKKLRVDYVLLCGNILYSIKELHEMFPGALIVAGNSINSFAIKKLIEESKNAGIPLYSLSENGTLLVDIKS